MDLSVLAPRLDTIAALFGSPDPGLIILKDLATGVRVDASALTAGCRYSVALKSEHDTAMPWIPIKQIASRLDEAVVRKLSLAFYARVWADTEHAAFRAMFVGSVETADAAAEAQWRWLIEMWGGAKRYSEQFGDRTLMKRMLAKHGATRMRYQFCRLWLLHMMAAMQEVGIGSDDAAVAESVPRYWLHFFGFFALSEAERQELRRLALG